MPKVKQYSELDDIKKDLTSLKKDTIKLAEHVKKDGATQASHLKEVVSEQADHLQDMGKSQLKNLEKQVKAKPAQSVAIAFAAGVLTSILLGRR
ncbi:MAG: hypothetical protein CMH30_04760 [Micavibrio sp.]|nr:hypothetical protein [Micavibrio sp.]|tara:strand:+ start:1791 stop:2072 length:282 start_codon:yes stop_codon:yes gene_type:complete